MIENSSKIRANKVDVQNTGEQTVVETNSETPLPGSNINKVNKTAHARPAINVTTVSRASKEENVVGPIFGPGIFSASLSTNPFGI